MEKITATIAWNRKSSKFSDNRYSRAHTWIFDGGTEVPASSSPGVVPVPMSDPVGVDPEEALVASLSSCHMLWFLAIASKNGFVVDEYNDNALGAMGQNSDGKLYLQSVTLRPAVTWSGNIPTEEKIVGMHEQAHSECFIANSVKSTVRIDPI